MGCFTEDDTCFSEAILSMGIRRHPALVPCQEWPGNHRKPPWWHENDGRANVGTTCRLGMTNLGRELGNLLWQQGWGNPAPLQLLDMQETRGSRLTVQGWQPPPPPALQGGSPIVLAFQPLVVEEAGRSATADDAGVLEAHHCSALEKAANARDIDTTTRLYRSQRTRTVGTWNDP